LFKYTLNKNDVKKHYWLFCHTVRDQEKNIITKTPVISKMVSIIPNDPITVVILFFISVDNSDFKVYDYKKSTFKSFIFIKAFFNQKMLVMY